MKITDGMVDAAYRAIDARGGFLHDEQIRFAIAAVAPLILEEAAKVAKAWCDDEEAGARWSFRGDGEYEIVHRIRALTPPSHTSPEE